MSVELGELPDSWSWVPLKDLLSEPLINGRSVKTMEGGFPVLRLTAIKAGKIDLGESKEGQWGAEEAAPYLVRAGDFLLSRGNGSKRLVGRGGVVSEPVVPVAFPDTMIRVRPDRRFITVPYLRLLWDSPVVRRQIEERVRTTAGIYKVNHALLEAVALPLPPLAEQSRIVESLEEQLSRLDAAAASAKQAVGRVDRLKAGLLAADLVNIEKRTRLRDVLASPLINGRSVKTMDGGFPVLRLTAIKDGGIDLGERKQGAWDAEDARPFFVKRGDFLVARGNGSLKLVGKGGLVGKVSLPVAFPDTMIRVRPNVEIALPEYLALVWGSPGVRKQIEGRARTTAGIYKVNQEILESIQFPLPSVDQQQVIVDRQMHIETVLQIARTSGELALRRGTALKQALLRVAFEGALVPQDMSDEPAADMLARLAVERAAQPRASRTHKAPTKKSALRRTAASADCAPEPTPAPALAVQQEFDL
ncbi:restriction endonuclease subunit S [Streptomyces sp. ISL-22]|uniref:restriction endonuclease subunit S n=1 Tax=unclassified Streptomyces TaxID=2593676 RepID=UPI001BE9CDB0|nr:MULTISPECIES: restriction endonuclease subunit S [unclassified Streptomyces]MBT2423601.1 restriction endonuclease subunit S [Streptomyces sp. ISL-24]MBT2437202.1 restriction endonuclease subunit S [Streptomyces sp. ISL-22]